VEAVWADAEVAAHKRLKAKAIAFFMVSESGANQTIYSVKEERRVLFQTCRVYSNNHFFISLCPPRYVWAFSYAA
jgi:hypothetical protein